jgi:maltooligosyltrehalose trehalohydrolase
MSDESFGALPTPAGVRFRLWAPAARQLTLALLDGRAAGEYPMAAAREDGLYGVIVPRARAGDRYGYRLDGGELRPDPASRFQPDGVHGPSQVIDPSGFAWTDRHWGGRPPADRIVYELHIGTFTPEGTFHAAAGRLEALRDVGVTVLEIMPVADFPGMRNWGYDGVCPFAPSRAYGTPDDLRHLVDRAHHLGLAVLLDVVYNHLGPEGAYLTQFTNDYFSDRHETPWGNGVNLDGPHSAMVRRFIVDNAVHWIREYHFDGLRLDATHALVEDDSGAIVREIVTAARGASAAPVLVHAEDHRNLAAMITEVSHGGWAVDGVWADDFHHVLRRLLAGDDYGYYSDFFGTVAELAQTIQRGWLFTGQCSRHLGGPRGTDPSSVPMHRFVVCLQNHDQVGNRALGDRLHHAVPPASWRAASVVLLTVPMTPLIFMGQEWSASTPFQYFTDLEPSLGTAVTEGRRREFADFPEFADPEARAAIPDPQDVSTFSASKLRWDERAAPAHRGVLELYRALATLRLDHPALGASQDLSGDATAVDQDTLAMRRANGEVFWIVARFKTGGTVDLSRLAADREEHATGWDVVLTTEDPLFIQDPQPPVVDPSAPRIRFERAGAVILKKT